jgi:predicted PurR-regulated permease PerM
MNGIRLSHRLSLWMLVACVVGVGICFTKIVLPLLIPLFLALAAALLFMPVYARMVGLCRGHRRIAALLATLSIVLLVILPIAAVLFLAGQQLSGLAGQLMADADSYQGRLRRQLLELRQTLTDEEYSQWRQGILEGQPPESIVRDPQNARAGAAIVALSRTYSSVDLAKELTTVTVADVFQPENSAWIEDIKARCAPYVESETLQRLTRSASTAVGRTLSGVYERTTGFISNAVAAIIMFAVMAVAVYYFLADGPTLAETAKSLVPLGEFEEEFLFRRFDELCRGVILGTIASAVVQGALMGIGLAVTGSEFVWLLASVTVVFSMIPFLGAAGVYIPVAAILLTQGKVGSAVFLLLYGIAIVSTSDNLVRIHVLNGRARLHPLVGLISMLGGLEVLGLWGIFVGPIVAGLFYSLLRLLRTRLDQFDAQQRAPPEKNGAQPPGVTGTGIVLVTE